MQLFFLCTFLELHYTRILSVIQIFYRYYDNIVNSLGHDSRVVNIWYRDSPNPDDTVVFFPLLCQACLTQLDEEFVFNPLSLSSNLYQHLRSRGLLSQPRYPYRSEGVGCDDGLYIIIKM